MKCASLFVCLFLFVGATTSMAAAPYIGIVGNDIQANPFYLGPNDSQFLNDDSAAVGEAFSPNRPIIQPEICDTTGTGFLPGSTGPSTQGFFPPFNFRGNYNARVTAGNAGTYRWIIDLPKTPTGDIQLCIECGVLVPNAFTWFGFNAAQVCSAETGWQGIEPNNCSSQGTVATALPTIKAVARPGENNPDFPAFSLTTDAGTVLNGGVATRVILKSCANKCFVTRLPVTGQVNASGQVEHALLQGDQIEVTMQIPRQNTVDIYCHQESVKLSGIGE